MKYIRRPLLTHHKSQKADFVCVPFDLGLVCGYMALISCLVVVSDLGCGVSVGLEGRHFFKTLFALWYLLREFVWCFRRGKLASLAWFSSCCASRRCQVMSFGSRPTGFQTNWRIEESYLVYQGSRVATNQFSLKDTSSLPQT